MNNIEFSVKDFSLEKTMECGQCFNFEKISQDKYVILAFNKAIIASQVGDKLCIESSEKDIWENYFDLKRDYSKIKKEIIKTDKKMKPVVDAAPGIRILNQEFYEMVISFIVSQRQNIPQIKNIIRRLAKNYGKFLCKIEGKEYYSFPSIWELSKLEEKDFVECKCGYRSAYLVEAVKWLVNLYKKLGLDADDVSGRQEDNNHDLDSSNETCEAYNAFENNKVIIEYFENMPFSDVRKKLLSVKGIGEKVCDCILLFALHYTNAFPVDVWIHRVANELYFDEMCDYFNKKIVKEDKNLFKPCMVKDFGENKFGVNSGYAQQYMFEYGRNSNVTKN